MERRHFHVLDVASAVRPLEFDPHIRKVDLTIEERQLVVMRPLFDLSSVAVWSSVCVRMIAIPLVQELLVFAFQFVVEDNPMNANVVFLKPLRGSSVGRVQLCVMREFTRPDVPRIERLTRFVIGRPVALEKLASSVRYVGPAGKAAEVR